MKRELQDESLWEPQTPAKTTPATLNSEDVLPVGTINSEILTKQHHVLHQSDMGTMSESSKAQSEEAKPFTTSPSTSILTPSEKIIRAKRKAIKKKRYRPKVVREVKIQKATKTKNIYPSTPKLRIPKPPKVRPSRKILGQKSHKVVNNTLKVSHGAFQDAYVDFIQVLDPSPGVSPDIFTKATSSTIFVDDCDINCEVENGREKASPLTAKECGCNKLMDLKPEVDSKSCRRALNFDSLLENDQGDHPKDDNASCLTWQRGNSSKMLVYHRRFKLEHINLQNHREKGSPQPTIECGCNKSMDLKPEVDSKSCRLALNFDSLLENDQVEHLKDDNAYCPTWLRRNNSKMLVYHRRFKLEKIDLQNHRKFGPDFPKIFRKARTGRRTTFTTFITSLLSVQRQNGITNNPLMHAVAGKDAKLNIVKKIRTERKGKILPKLPSVVGINSEQNYDRPGSKVGKNSCSWAINDPRTINMNLVPSLYTPSVRTTNESYSKLYCGYLVPYSAPPLKKLRGLEDIMKKIQRLCIGDLRKQRAPKIKSSSGVGGELVLYQTKKNKHMPKVAVDQETESEWNLLMHTFCGGADEERGDDREKWWEEERKKFRVRMLTFIAIMHIIQGDRRFSEWKGSVVDSVVGVFLTQNVSDHLSSSAFMSLASRFPIKSTKELEYVNSNHAETIPTVQEVESQTDKCSRESCPLERKSFLQMETPSETKVSDSDKNQAEEIDWDELRKTYGDSAERDSSDKYLDSVDWEAVRLAPPKQVSDAIQMRGQHVVIGSKIQAFLNRLVRDHGSIDLEWLRNVPPDKAKNYLLSFDGLGLKSVECIRLLCLHHHAFPVDINVSRVAVRLGWVPIQPLPGGLEFHLLDQYPLMDAVQVYLWPRLCKLEQKILYELHYQCITFGKVLCKKLKPGCGPCPLRGDCKHYASEVASFRRSLPGVVKEKSTSSAIVSISPLKNSLKNKATMTESVPRSSYQNDNVEPIIEYPPSPVPVSNEILVRDIEDWYGQTDAGDEYENENEDVCVNEDKDLVVNVNGDYIPTISIGIDECNENEDVIPTLGSEELKKRLQEAMRENNIDLSEDDMSKALVALSSEASSIPAPKLKNVGRLKTIHHVYELPDSHPILAGELRREPDDPSPYLLVIWASEADADPSKPTRSQSCSQTLELCDREMSCSPGNKEDQKSETVPGTLMIPCRTATRGRFPLNGTYFQVNEVFVDDESSMNPVQVPRKWLWNLKRRFLYCGSSASAIFTGCSLEEIQHCFWKGYVCVRAFNRKTRTPVDLPDKFHVSTVSKKAKENGNKRKHTQDKKEKVKGNTPRASPHIY